MLPEQDCPARLVGYPPRCKTDRTAGREIRCCNSGTPGVRRCVAFVKGIAAGFLNNRHLDRGMSEFVEAFGAREHPAGHVGSPF
jgi:hypothetical protein